MSNTYGVDKDIFFIKLSNNKEGGSTLQGFVKTP